MYSSGSMPSSQNYAGQSHPGSSGSAAQGAGPLYSPNHPHSYGVPWDAAPARHGDPATQGYYILQGPVHQAGYGSVPAYTPAHGHTPPAYTVPGHFPAPGYTLNNPGYAPGLGYPPPVGVGYAPQHPTIYGQATSASAYHTSMPSPQATPIATAIQPIQKGQCVRIHTKRRIFAFTSGCRSGLSPVKHGRPSLVISFEESDAVIGGRIPTIAPLTSAKMNCEVVPRSGNNASQWCLGMPSHATQYRAWWSPVNFVPRYPPTADRQPPAVPNDPYTGYHPRTPVSISWDNSCNDNVLPSFMWIGDSGEVVDEPDRINHLLKNTSRHLFMNERQLTLHNWHCNTIENTPGVPKPRQFNSLQF